MGGKTLRVREDPFFVMTEIPKHFDPAAAEDKWYGEWVKKGYFKPEANPTGEPYCIVIPPPNVTGTLHMGHALNTTLQDILIRHAKMSGRRALWLPGTDHAGIATQNVVERALEAEGTDRHTLGREAFIEKVWEWKKEYGGKIIHQLEKLGASCDWSRERFTLDEGLSQAVKVVFVRLYEEGLIYRATRLINWCPRCQTALSDLEVEHEDIDGSLTYIKYPLADGSGHVVVATTRPETMLGDTAVAVNPEDPRYGGFVGNFVKLPLTDRLIPIIADEEVELEFGSGALKITPAHDFNDEAIGKRHGLEQISVIGPDGSMTALAGQRYAGMQRFQCRDLVLSDLKEQGLFEKQDSHTHAVGHCYRCSCIIEPLSTPQWYVKVGPMAKEAADAVREGKIRIIPEGWKNSYFSWMDNINDWCISRQIWWGHRIPVWYCPGCSEIIVSVQTPAQCPKCGDTALRQDEDVLDTWFSSSLWPFSTLGWPGETGDLKAFYPTSVLVTAFDILFFWVARMAMMGLKFMGDVPFHDVYIHALVRDSEGRKMSKSKGNAVDPLIMIEKYGADAFRFSLAAFAGQGRDIRFSEDRVVGYSNFINKLWNAMRFTLARYEAEVDNPAFMDVSTFEEKLKGDAGGDARAKLPLGCRWIQSRLRATAGEVQEALSGYHFNDAANAVYQFIWHELCDWYIEMAKAEDAPETTPCLLHTLNAAVRLLHPFMPFVTEEIWHILPGDKAQSILISEYPLPTGVDQEAEAAMAHIMEAVGGIRSIRGELGIQPGQRVTAVINTATKEVSDVLTANLHYLGSLAMADIKAGQGLKRPEGAATSVRNMLEVYVPLHGLLDIGAETKRLSKEMEKVDKSLRGVRMKLENEDFLSKAPEDVIHKQKAKVKELEQKRAKLNEGMQRIKSLEV